MTILMQTVMGGQQGATAIDEKPASDISPIKVLLVEDNPGDARLIQIMLEGAGNGGVDQDVLAICGAAGLPFPEPIPLEEPETYSATASRSQSMFRSLTSVCWNDANGNTTVPSSATLTITYRTTSAVAASTTGLRCLSLRMSGLTPGARAMRMYS